MPARLLIRLEPVDVEPFDPARQVGPGMHAAVLRALRAVDPALSARVHDWSGPKPMALAALLQRNTLEVGVVDDGLLAPVRRALSPGRSLRLDRSEYAIRAVRVAHRSWKELADAAVPPPWSLRFVTPTTFHTNRDDDNDQKIRCNRPVPDPEYVFGSLLRRWQAHAPVPLRNLNQRTLAWSVTLDDYQQLTTARHLVNTCPRVEAVGFTGLATFAPRQHSPRPPARITYDVGVLVTLALFAGVGANIMQGMGCVRLIPPSRRRSVT